MRNAGCTHTQMRAVEDAIARLRPAAVDWRPLELRPDERKVLVEADYFMSTNRGNLVTTVRHDLHY